MWPATRPRLGDIVTLSGIENITIGDTLCDPNAVEPLPFVKISEPTVEMTFSVNNSPFAGREGKFVTSRHLRDRLHAGTAQGRIPACIRRREQRRRFLRSGPWRDAPVHPH